MWSPAADGTPAVLKRTDNMDFLASRLEQCAAHVFELTTRTGAARARHVQDSVTIRRNVMRVDAEVGRLLTALVATEIEWMPEPPPDTQ